MSLLFPSEDRNDSEIWLIELQKSPRLCEKCQKKVRDMDSVAACSMPPSLVLDMDDYHPHGCLNILCQDCASSGDHPFSPCRCHVRGGRDNLIWCPDCTKDFKKCNACQNLLCPRCKVNDTKDYGLLCHHCCWAMYELLGRIPEGANFDCPPWSPYVIPDDVKKAVETLHKKIIKATINSDEDEKPAATEPQKFMFVLVQKEGDPFRETTVDVIGVYSNKQLAVDAAKEKFKDISEWYRDGEWSESVAFQETLDNTTNVASIHDGTLLRQVDQEGSFEEISIHRAPLDENYECKALQERERKRSRSDHTQIKTRNARGW